MMQLNQRRHRDTRRADLHPGAGDGVQHPRRDYRHYARCGLDIGKATSAAPLAAVQPDTTPVEWVPTIIDLNLVPDMGRMIARLL
jgi:hypothetical protein